MLGAILGGIASLGGTLLGGNIAKNGQEAANIANAHQAELNRQFQERMSNTSYQRAVADMRAAGLNPALAYQQGGASSPTGSSATMENTASDLGAGIAHAVPEAVNTAMAAQQYKQLQAATAQTQAQTESINNDIALKNIEVLREKWRDQPNDKGKSLFQRLTEAQLTKALSDINVSNASARDINAGATLKELQKSGAEAQDRVNKNLYGRYFRPYINDALSAKKIFD